MFKFSEKLNFKWPVKVIEPHPDIPGELIEHEFIALFEVMPPEESDAMTAARRKIEKKVTPDMTEAQLDKVQKELDEHDLKTLKRVLRGWEGLIDANDDPMPFTEKTFRALYPHRRIRNALTRSYIEALSEDRARLGN